MTATTHARHTEERVTMRTSLIGKRLFDLVFVVPGLIILAPLMLGIGLAIRLDSPGPALYRAQRIGRFGVPFRMYKFRTMVRDADKIGGTSTAESDPRITRVGRFLRRYKLDELPQLLNVLIGNMSLVGPRPEVEEYTCLYSHEERQILDVLPGMTDFASIEFMHLNSILARTPDADEHYRVHIRPIKNQLRLRYARTRTFWIDIQILVKTLTAVISRKRNDGT